MLFLPVLGNRFKVADIRRGSHFSRQDDHHGLHHDHTDADVDADLHDFMNHHGLRLSSLSWHHVKLLT